MHVIRTNNKELQLQRFDRHNWPTNYPTTTNGYIDWSAASLGQKMANGWPSDACVCVYNIRMFMCILLLYPYFWHLGVKWGTCITFKKMYWTTGTVVHLQHKYCTSIYNYTVCMYAAVTNLHKLHFNFILMKGKTMKSFYKHAYGIQYGTLTSVL